MLVVDALLYAAMFWRGSSDPGQLLVAHYISFVVISDIGALFLPAAKRHWFNVFRLTGGVSFLVLTVALWVQGLDGGVVALSLARCVLCSVRIAQSAWLIKRHGPWLGEVRGLPERIATFYREGDRSMRLAFGFIVIAGVAFFFAAPGYWTHDNEGVLELDAALTGMLAQNGFNAYLKLFLFEVMIIAALPRFGMRAVVAGFFVVQWPLAPSIYFDAPIPIAHGAIETYQLVLAAFAFSAWRAGLAGVTRPLPRV